MHCNKTTRDKLAEIQDKGEGLTPLELRQESKLAEQVAGGVGVYSAVAARVGVGGRPGRTRDAASEAMRDSTGDATWPPR